MLTMQECARSILSEIRFARARRGDLVEFYAESASSSVTGAFGTPMVHPGRGPYFSQYPMPNFAPLAWSQFRGIFTPVGSALQYGRDPGFARYCWW